MSPVRNRLVEMIDCMPEQEQLLLFEIAKRFVSDDIASADDLQAIKEAHEDLANGETVSHDDIDWE